MERIHSNRRLLHRIRTMRDDDPRGLRIIQRFLHRRHNLIHVSKRHARRIKASKLPNLTHNRRIRETLRHRTHQILAAHRRNESTIRAHCTCNRAACGEHNNLLSHAPKRATTPRPANKQGDGSAASVQQVYSEIHLIYLKIS